MRRVRFGRAVLAVLLVILGGCSRGSDTATLCEEEHNFARLDALVSTVATKSYSEQVRLQTSWRAALRRVAARSTDGESRQAVSRLSGGSITVSDHGPDGSVEKDRATVVRYFSESCDVDLEK